MGINPVYAIKPHHYSQQILQLPVYQLQNKKGMVPKLCQQYQKEIFYFQKTVLQFIDWRIQNLNSVILFEELNLRKFLWVMQHWRNLTNPSLDLRNQRPLQI